MRMALDVWKCTIQGNGEQSVMIPGVLMMPWLHVVSLVIYTLFDLFISRKFPMVQDRYGWMMCNALEMNEVWLIVVIMDGEVITADIVRMQELNVLRQVKNKDIQ